MNDLLDWFVCLFLPLICLKDKKRKKKKKKMHFDFALIGYVVE